MIKVTIFNDFYNDHPAEEVNIIYPDGIPGHIAAFLKGRFEVNIVRDIDENTFADTDVFIYLARSHDELPDSAAKIIQQNVLRGMGAVFLHSAHLSKPFGLLMGTSCTLKYRQDCRERLWCTAPGHPIAKHIPEQFELKTEEMYGEFFDIPKPDDIVFLGWFSTGEVFRSGVTFTRGLGKIFYFQPGHETNPTFHDKNIQQIIRNAAEWAAPDRKINPPTCVSFEALER